MIMAEAISTSGDEFTDDDEDEEELDPRVHVSLCIHRVLAQIHAKHSRSPSKISHFL